MSSQGNDCWSQVHGLRRIDEGFNLLANDLFGKLGFTLALLQIRVHDIAQIVNVVQKDVVDLIDFRVHISRHRNVNDKHRTVPSKVNDAFAVRSIQDKVVRPCGADNDVCPLKLLEELLGSNRLTSKDVGEIQGPLIGPIPDEYV